MQFVESIEVSQVAPARNIVLMLSAKNVQIVRSTDDV